MLEALEQLVDLDEGFSADFLVAVGHLVADHFLLGGTVTRDVRVHENSLELHHGGASVGDADVVSVHAAYLK